MKALIVFYSRTGVTRAAAQRLAEELRSAGAEAAVEEILDTKDRRGIAGWFGGGKDATLKRATTIEPVKADVGSFDVVVVGTPVWAWTATPAARAFLTQHGAACRAVAFFCTMGGSGDKGAFSAMKDLCGKAPVATLALLDRKVKGGDDDKYLAPVREFARSITDAAGTQRK